MIVTTDAHATIEERLEAVFPVRFVPRPNNEEQPSVLFVSHVKYLGVIFSTSKRIIWRLHTEIIETKAFRTFRIHSLFKSEHWLDRNDLCLLRLGISGRRLS
jgi:hypothetical protein